MNRLVLDLIMDLICDLCRIQLALLHEENVGIVATCTISRVKEAALDLREEADTFDGCTD